MHKFLFSNKFIISLYILRALCVHHQEVKIVLYSIWYHHTVGGRRCTVLSQPAHRGVTYKCDDTRCCITQFLPADDDYNGARNM